MRIDESRRPISKRRTVGRRAYVMCSLHQTRGRDAICCDQRQVSDAKTAEGNAAEKPKAKICKKSHPNSRRRSDADARLICAALSLDTKGASSKEPWCG